MIDLLAKASTIDLIVWSIYVGAMISVFATFFVRKVLGKAIRALIEKGCSEKESAKTLSMLGLDKNIFIKGSLRNGILKSFVSFTEKETDGKTEKYYYLTEDKRIKSELRFSDKGTDIFGIIIALVVFAAIAYALTRFIPYIIGLYGEL